MNKTVAIVVFAGVQSLDVSGPMDVFAEANRFLPPEDHYRLQVIGVEHGPMACSNGLTLNAHRHFSEALDAYDLIVIGGGAGGGKPRGWDWRCGRQEKRSWPAVWSAPTILKIT